MEDVIETENEIELLVEKLKITADEENNLVVV